MNLIALFTLAAPVLVLLTNMLTDVIKSLHPWLAKRARGVTAATALLLSLGAVQCYLQTAGIAPAWYWYAGAVVLGGVVAYTAASGYDGLYDELLNRLKGWKGVEKP